MRKLIFVFIGFASFYSCIDHSSQSAWRDHYDGPTTKKERDYLNELKSQGFNDIEFVVPIIERTPKYGGHYGINLKLNKWIDSTNLDSIQKVRDEIANHLYTDIIADSTLVAINKIVVNIELPEGYYPKGEKPFLYESYYKDSLARKNNLKIVKLGKYAYDRVPYWKK